MAENLPSNPIILFSQWFDEAVKQGQKMPEAMALATSDKDNQPSVRFLLLKGWSDKGFCFYTNYDSRKAKELNENPKAAMAFHWLQAGKQIRIVGKTERLSREDSEHYAHSRPRDSQISAWASKQSQPLPDRSELLNRVEEYKSKFGDGLIPCPENWGGYLLKPHEIEFWSDRADRLHERITYYWRTHQNSWQSVYLYP